jgi:hypothetical protein
VAWHPDAEHKAFFQPTTASTRTTRGWARWSGTGAIKSLAEGMKKANLPMTEKTHHRLGL